MPRHRRAPAYNPFAMLSPKAQRHQANLLVNSQIVPLIAQINAEIGRHARSGAAAISGNTEAYARMLAPLASQTRSTYTAAEGRQSADDAAIADRLSRVGGDVAAGLRAQLQAAGQNTDVANAAVTQGAGAAGAVQAAGSTALAALRAHGAAAEAYSGQLPGIARVGGAQRLGQLLAQLESERSTQVGAVREKVPGLVASVGQQIRDQEFQKAVAAQSGLVDQQKLQLDTAYKSAKVKQGWASINQRAAKNKTDAYFKQGGLDIRRDNYDLAVKREERLGRTKAGKKGGFTPSQLSHLRATAIESAKDYKHGREPTHYANGDVKDPGMKGRNDPRELFRALVNHGIPPSMADWATGQVFGGWRAPGEQRKRGPGGTGPR